LIAQEARILLEKPKATPPPPILSTIPMCVGVFGCVGVASGALTADEATARVALLPEILGCSTDRRRLTCKLISLIPLQRCSYYVIS